MSKYDPQKIEPKWQKRWEEDKAFRADDKSRKEKFYCLDMFPYPSSHGLHVGHPEGYTATDIISRYQRMKGKEVIHPMGWDAFGLPAENFAIKTGVHPMETTAKSIETFRKQIKSLGFSYDWDREINTSSPEYYRWTQWIFLQLYKNRLAYKKKAAANWCESCKTVLANEQVMDGKCERCKNEVEQRDLEQWFFKVTDYTGRLLDDLEKINWPEPIKLMQREWIGKSEGAMVKFQVTNAKSQISKDEYLEVFTTRPDTLFGCTYMVVAPEHKLVEKFTNCIENLDEIKKYQEGARKKSDLERTDLQKDKSGVELKGLKAINPVNDKEIPVFVADYVLVSYGSGAIMAVPAHDERDWEFAKKYRLEIIPVVIPKGGSTGTPEDTTKGEIDKIMNIKPFTGEGIVINSDEFNGMKTRNAKKVITKKVEGKLTINYKLRDWLISRQRYWGAPIPIIHCDKCGEVPVPEDQLPVELPTDVDFKPTGESPLKDSKTFHDIECPKCGSAKVHRESDTMDTFVCSSWYHLRYCDPHNDQAFADQEKMAHWMPVDLYVGGAEHACMHLIYARFFYKALKDLGHIKIDSTQDHDEPYQMLKNQGMILGEDHQKMSKSRGNVVNPDDVIKIDGADTLRLYEMFMGAFEDTKPWDTKSIRGVRRFLDRVWDLYDVNTLEIREEVGHISEKYNEEDKPLLHKTIKGVTEDIEDFKFNTAISKMMILVNGWSAKRNIDKNDFGNFIKLLSPFAPHISEELWEKLGHKESIFKEEWPEYDPEKIIEDTIELVVQVNGKVRDKMSAPTGISKEEALKLAKESERIKKHLGESKIKKIIFVPDKLLNLVV